jgi:EAL domain-containing protein (putative c-di-GMP-specific phosphodiesterase class I)
MPASETSLLTLEKELRDAVESEAQLEAHFQPIYDAGTGNLIGVETLARWRHPRRGLVQPADFIELAEETGLIMPLGLQILRRACAHAVEWANKGLPEITVSVNVSAAQIREPELARSIKQVLRDAGMPPGRLVLEVTESTLIGDLDRATGFMDDLGASGVKFALDDFGVGYSSLSYLARLPVQIVKIDRSFIRDIRYDPRSEATIRAMVALGHALELHVTAEGIETLQILQHVKRLCCDSLQGFWLGKPMPADDLEAVLFRGEYVAELRELPLP